MTFENLFNKGGLNSSFFRLFRDYLRRPPDLLWSRGWYHAVDHVGDDSILYRALPTRYMLSSLSPLIGKKGLIWLRLGSYPVNKNWGAERIGDLALFARDVIGNLSGPSVLVTTDGDMSVPSDLPAGTAEKILEDPNIVAWFSQNLDGSMQHPKLFPVPIGLGLHVGTANRLIGVADTAKKFLTAKSKILADEKRICRVWSDTHLRTHPYHGETRTLLADAIKSGVLSRSIDYPKKRLSQLEVWKMYGSYVFVMSLPGHGWDCYRTWEALGLGAIVITVHSPLDEMLSPYRVVFLDSKKDQWWCQLLDKEWLEHARQEASAKPIVDLSWRSWINKVRAPLDSII